MTQNSLNKAIEDAHNKAIADAKHTVYVIDSVRKAYELFHHHKSLTKKGVDFIREALSAYTVSFGTSYTGGPLTIGIWGNGIHFDQRIYMILSSDAPTWQSAFERELQRCDMRDYLERYQAELALLPKLQKLSSQISDLRSKADALVATLPEPPSTNLRATMWSGASTVLTSVYPELFKTT